MTLAARLLWAAGLLGVLAGATAWLLGGEEPAAGARTARWHSSKQCKACHEEVYREWQGSHHQIAYTNPEVRALSDDFRKKECQDCHLPRPVATTGFGKRTLPRLTAFDEGVSCLSCHLDAGGGILAARDRPDAPCAPRASEGLASVALCESCHNQHQTTDQWRASPYAAKGVACNDCHMPEVVRPGGRTGRNHAFPGAHDADMLRRAGEFDVSVEDGELVLRLTNTGAGHNFPTEERHRAVDLMYRFELAGGGFTEWALAHRARQPYRDEPGENTQLPAGESVVACVPIPDGAVRAEARLWYRLTPFATDGDDKSTLLAEREVVLQ